MSGYQLCTLSHKKRKHLVRSRRRSERFPDAYEFSTECGEVFVALDPTEPDPAWPLCKNCASTERGQAYLRKSGG